MAARAPAGDGDGGGELERAIGSVSRGITDPVAKLRYIRRSLADYQAADRHVRAVPSPLLRRLLYRLLSLAGLRHAVDTGYFGYAAAGESASGRMLVLSRISVAAAALLVAVGLVRGGLHAAGPRLVRWSLGPAASRRRRRHPPLAIRPRSCPRDASTPARSASGEGQGSRIQNVLRISTVCFHGASRRYRSSTGRRFVEASTRLVGDHFHTTESDSGP